MDKPILFLTTLAARYLPGSVKAALYRYPPLARRIRDQLNRSLEDGPVVVEIAGGELAGMSMLLNLRSEKDYWLGTYEPDLQQAVKDLVEPGMVAYDVGANIGYISLLIARRVAPTGKVYSFEPLPDNLERLNRNLALNQMTQVVQVVPSAVIDAGREVDFQIGPSGGTGKASGSAGRQNLSYSRTISVPGLSLDEFIMGEHHPPPQVVKVDVEGGETLALPGMRRTLREFQPAVLLELHGPEAAEVAWHELTEAGYRVFRMTAGYPTVRSIDLLEWKAYLVALSRA
jgi:FkbM family methyltransferase